MVGLLKTIGRELILLRPYSAADDRARKAPLQQGMWGLRDRFDHSQVRALQCLS